VNAFSYVSLIALFALATGCSTDRPLAHDNDPAYPITSGYSPFTPEGIALVHNLCQGQWKSDHDGTMAWLRAHRTPSKRMLDAYDRLFGHAIVTVTNNYLIFEIGGKSQKKPIHILAASRRQIVMQMFDDELGRDVFVISDFDADSQEYWVYVPQHDMKEHFVHIAGPNAPANPKSP